MGLIIVDIINRHGLYIKKNTDFTYQQSTMVRKSGKSTIDLTLNGPVLDKVKKLS